MFIAPHTNGRFYTLFVYDQYSDNVMYKVIENDTGDFVSFSENDEPKFKILLENDKWESFSDPILQFVFNYYKQLL